MNLDNFESDNEMQIVTVVIKRKINWSHYLHDVAFEL